MSSRTLTKALGPVADPAFRRRFLLVSTLGLVSLATVLMGFSSAVFTDQTTIGANTFSTGTIDLTTSPTSAAISFSGMLPGDVVTAPVTVSNTGTAQLRYAVTSTTTENTLAAQLSMVIKTGVTTCTNAGFAGSGSSVYAAGPLGTTAEMSVIGDRTQGNQSGDRVLSSSGSEVLCVQVTLPLATGNGYQGLTTTATFTFYSEQTANN